MVIDEQFDVVVAGGGPSGITAAIASARSGAKTLLIEKYGFLGGMATNALVGPLQTFHAGEKQIAKGIGEEVIQRLKQIGGTPGHVRDMIGFVPTVTPVDVEKLKYIYQEMAEESDVKLQLHTVVTGVELKEEGTLKALQLYNKSGHYKVQAKVFIDCTGDGDVVAMAGVPYEKGRPKDGLAQPMSMMFRMGKVNLEKVKEYMRNNPDDFVLAKDWDSFPMVAVSGFFSLVKKAKEEGRFTIDRDRVLLFELPTEGEVSVNMTRVIRYDATDGQALSKAEIISRRQVMEVVQFLQRDVPGFEEAILINCGTQIGVRESRRIIGEYVLTGEDVVTGRKFDDVIALGSYPIDIHAPDGDEINVIQMEPGTIYDIPYRSILNKEVPNLLVAGRCLSATHEALASARVTPTAMLVGQAAGTAAAIAVHEEQLPRNISIEKLQQSLRKQECYLTEKEIEES
ncbi:ribulose 1,5-bisphosphate synthetase/thiazole synthase [Evansella vedderi]|uniref:Ribulose 1,5-bisphosphate synthetase/thiazole synthase n=1 Tax=Evansella vedderi TaxID=38282 RepID=A0ABT9ZP90_9BACI|nr:FAD-dependent oxidoreductase [Evansella vedderi]MDQ0253009.1 ribulose 1,5-bisphosphate synthetase/thiazole synthase [Evansella vedderi]